MGKSSFTPNARNTDRPQPEVCQVTGDLTPSQDLIVADVEGLRGAHIGSTYPWLAKVRLLPSYNDLRRLNPGPPLESSQQKGLSGGSLWFRGGTNISEQDVCIVPGPDGELIEVITQAPALAGITTEGDIFIATESGSIITIDG